MTKTVTWILGLMLVILVVCSAALGGFLTSYSGLGPFNDLAAKVERKIDKLNGKPSELVARLDVIETTNLRLRGTVYDIPRTEHTSGGALEPWGKDLLVMDQQGTIRVLIDGEGIVSTKIQTPDNGSQAYKIIAASEEYSSYSHTPDRQRFNELLFINTDKFYALIISYSYFNSKEVCYTSRVAWLEIPRNASATTFESHPDDWEVIFETNPCLELNNSWTAFDGMMAGGRMVFEPPSTLYFGSGEYHLDGVHTYDVGIQSPDNDYGKVIAIDLGTHAAHHYSIGHRNIQGMTIDKTGRLWTTEHMIRGGDELNLIREGGNYGWPLETYGSLYSGLPFPNQGEEGRHLLHNSPAYAWLPSVGVSGLTHIDGFYPAWDGDLIATSLSNSDYGQSLFRIRVEEDDVIFAERIRLEERLRYVTQWGQDRIAVLTDSRNVVIVFKAEERVDTLGRALEQLEAQLEPNLFSQVNHAVRACNQCHSFEPNGQGSAPSLAGIVGRKIGGGKYKNYSNAMAVNNGTWDRDKLVQFIVDPDSIVPGTSMPDQNLDFGPEVNHLVDLLSTIDADAQEHIQYD